MALKFRGNFNLVIFLIIKPTKKGSPKKKHRIETIELWENKCNEVNLMISKFYFFI